MIWRLLCALCGVPQYMHGFFCDLDKKKPIETVTNRECQRLYIQIMTVLWGILSTESEPVKGSAACAI